jgi:hypothetical protein
MHFVITYGSLGGTPEQIAGVNRSIEQALKPYQNYKALGNTYIVKINSVTDWQIILQIIGPIAQSAPIPVNFIMTPPHESGSTYNGWMPMSAWSEINKLTS